MRGAVVWAVLMGFLKLISGLRIDSRLLAWKARGQLGGICYNPEESERWLSSVRVVDSERGKPWEWDEDFPMD